MAGARAGVRELLVVSQDTSAYGVDLKYQTDFWQGRPLKTNLETLASALSEFGIWVRFHYVYPYPRVDSIIPMMAEGKILPYIDMPLQHGAPRASRPCFPPEPPSRAFAPFGARDGGGGGGPLSPGEPEPAELANKSS